METKNIKEEEKIPSLRELHEKYASREIQEVQTEIHRKFLTQSYVHLLSSLAKDSTLRFSIKDDNEVLTACINPDTGEVSVGKSLALACTEGEENGDQMFNLNLLNFIIGHEIGHYKDFYSMEGKEKSFTVDLENWEKWMKSLNKRIWEKWTKMHPENAEEISQLSEEEKQKMGTPLHALYHRFFNMLDDPFANKHSLDIFPNLENTGFDLPQVYDRFLFTTPDYAGKKPLCEQLGYYLLHKSMSPRADIFVDDQVREVLEKKHKINNKEMTLLELLQYLTADIRDRFKNMFYASRRYQAHYEKYFILAFEELMKIDQQKQEELDKYMEVLKKMPKNQQEDTDQSGKSNPSDKESQKESKPEKGGNGTPNPFGKILKEINDKKGEAKKAAKDKFDENKQANKEASKTDMDKHREDLNKLASKMANQHDLDLDKTKQYLEIKDNLREKIEEYAKFIVSILLREKTESYSIIERHKASGSVNTQDFINKFAGIQSGHKPSRKVMERVIINERLQNRTIRLNFRMLTDNSGSMSGLIRKLEERFVLMFNAFHRANQILKTEYNLPNIQLNTEMLIFGNSKSPGIAKSGGRLIKTKETIDDDIENFDINMIKAFNKITCDEGTDDSDAWRMVDEELYTPEETEIDAESNTESCSVVIAITDGYTDVNARRDTKKHLESLKVKKVKTGSIFLDNGQAEDVSISQYTQKARENIMNAKTTEERDRAREEYDNAVNAYQLINQQKASEGVFKSQTSCEELYGKYWLKINPDELDAIMDLTGMMILDATAEIDDILSTQTSKLQSV